jgi:hypothetical protein
MYAPKQRHQNMHTPFGREYKVVSTLGLPWPPPHPITHTLHGKCFYFGGRSILCCNQNGNDSQEDLAKFFRKFKKIKIKKWVKKFPSMFFGYIL